MGFPGSSPGKESTCGAGDPGLIPGLAQSPGEGKSNPFQYSCLENPYEQRSLAGYIQSMGSQRVGHDRETKHSTALIQFSSVAQSCPTLCDPWTAARQASLSITNSQNLLKLMSIVSVMPSSHLTLCHHTTICFCILLSILYGALHIVIAQ